MMNDGFEKEVITRLTIIETKIDDYNGVKEKSELAYNMAKQNKIRIAEIEDKNRFLVRTLITTIVAGLVGIGFIYLKMGMGVI